jgi:hypothetical protein
LSVASGLREARVCRASTDETAGAKPDGSGRSSKSLARVPAVIILCRWRAVKGSTDAGSAAVDDLRERHHRDREGDGLEAELNRCRSAVTTKSGDLSSIVEELIGALEKLPGVLGSGSAEERKAVVRAFLQGITIEKATRQATLRWYRLPRTGVSVKMVELRGLEPLTPRLPALCSPN